MQWLRILCDDDLANPRDHKTIPHYGSLLWTPYTRIILENRVYFGTVVGIFDHKLLRME